jgi:hypothetical protein
LIQIATAATPEFVMDSVREAADKAAGVVDKGVSEAVQLTTHTAQDLLSRGSELWDTAKVGAQSNCKAFAAYMFTVTFSR